MATYQTRKGKNRTTVTATIRLKGFPTLSRTFDSKGKAKIWVQETEGKIRSRRYRDPRKADKVSLGSALETYQERVSSKKAVTTRKREAFTARALLAGLGEDTPISMITPQAVASYRDKRLKTVSAYSVRLELAMLSHLFRIADMEWGLPVENPVDRIQRPPVPRGRDKFLTYDQAERLLDECAKRKNPHLYTYVLLLMHTGMRPGEAAELSWSSINLERGTILLRDTKNKTDRVVPLTESVKIALENLRPRPDQAEGYLFLTNKHLASKHIMDRPGDIFRTSFEAAREKAELPTLHLHDLRHTAASHLVMAGVDLRTLADILGHKTMQMVQRYTHLLDEHKIAAVSKINGLGRKSEDQ